MVTSSGAKPSNIFHHESPKIHLINIRQSVPAPYQDIRPAPPVPRHDAPPSDRIRIVDLHPPPDGGVVARPVQALIPPHAGRLGLPQFRGTLARTSLPTSAGVHGHVGRLSRQQRAKRRRTPRRELRQASRLRDVAAPPSSASVGLPRGAMGPLPDVALEPSRRRGEVRADLLHGGSVLRRWRGPRRGERGHDDVRGRRRRGGGR